MITVLNSVASHTASYNELPIYLESDKRYELDYKYLVKITDEQSSEVLREIEYKPNPLDGNRLLININKIIKDIVELPYNIDTGIQGNTKHIRLSFRDKYVENYQISDVTPTANFIQVACAGHPFQIDDIITLNVTSITGDPSNISKLNRAFRVGAVSTVGFTLYGLTKDDIGNSNIEILDGIAHYADKREIISNTGTDKITITIGVALDYSELASVGQNDLGNWDIKEGNLLTNKPNKFRVGLDSIFQLARIGGTIIKFENNLGSVFSKPSSGNIYDIEDVSPSVSGLILESGTGNLIEPGVKYYDVWLEEDPFKSNKTRFILDDRCKINNIQLVFFDRKSSVGSFQFNLVKDRFYKTEKEKIKIDKDYLTFETTNPSINTFSSLGYRELILRTNHLTEEENIYFEDLLSSRRLWMIEEGEWDIVEIEDGTTQTTLQQNERLFRRELRVKISRTIKIN